MASIEGWVKELCRFYKRAIAQLPHCDGGGMCSLSSGMLRSQWRTSIMRAALPTTNGSAGAPQSLQKSRHSPCWHAP